MSNDTYISLIASLPIAGDLFTCKQTPLSRLSLEARLRSLNDEDASVLKKIEELLRWVNKPMEATDAEFIQHAKHLLEELDNEFISNLVMERLSLRTALVALRKRKRGDSVPQSGEPWGAGRWVNHIQRYWSEPTFRLEGIYPWILEANRLLGADDTNGLERLILSEVWDSLGRASEGHYFDFEAVLIYVMRWDVIARWTSYSGKEAVERFNNLVESGLGEHADLFALH